MKEDRKPLPQRTIVCPQCGKTFQNWNNAKACIKVHRRELGISNTEMKWKMFFYTFPEFDTKEKFEKLYETKSIPDFGREYGCFQVSSLIDYYGLQHRTLSEVRRKITQKKFEETCLKKYGSKNPSSNETVKEKKRETFKKHYGVDNVFKDPKMIEYIQKGSWCIERYGCTRSELLSRKTKEWMNAMSDEELEVFMEKSVWKRKWDPNTCKSRGMNSSNLETKFARLLLEGSMDFETQFKLSYKKDNGRSGWKFYDFLLKDLKILVEVNGDFWHANPAKYKPDDLVNYRGQESLAKDVWKSNIFKEKIAQDNSYIMIAIWESELREIETFQSLNSLIQQKIIEVQDNGTTYKQEKDYLQ